MTKHKNTVILSILEEAHKAASEQTDPNFRSAALIEVAKSYKDLTVTDRNGNIRESGPSESEPMVG